jgi:sugar phosphate isomerase/epimerase
MNRRNFVRQASALLAGGFFYRTNFPSLNTPRLSFSTLGCPDWTFDQILAYAVKFGYSGIEWRGLSRQMDLTRCNEFIDLPARMAAKKKMKEAGLHFVNMGSSCTLHFPLGPERDKQLDEGKRYIDLAHDLGSPFIRVFPNNFLKEQTKERTIELIVSGLNELAAYTAKSGVRILMETHGDVVYADDVASIMMAVSSPHVGLIWDPANMWTITQEPPEDVFRKLKSFISHVHIKDASKIDGKWVYCFLGKGQIPLKEVLGVLQNARYEGFYSFEWEKLWHPELADPEQAMPHYPDAIRAYFS